MSLANERGLFLITEQNMADEVDIKTDVALIKKDVKQIEKYFGKFDAALETMAEMSKQVAVHGEVLKNTSEKLHDLDVLMAEHRQQDQKRAEYLTAKLEDYRSSSYADHQRLADESRLNRQERNAEIMSELHKMNGSLEKRLTSIDNRIKILENWKWYIMGAFLIIGIVATQVNWSILFG
jgi:hypothetical protein